MNPEENTNNSTQNSSMHKDPVLDFTKKNNSTVMGVLSYIGPLVIIPYLMNKDNDFVKFHTKQGLVLFGIGIVVMVLGNMMSFLWMFGSLLNLAILILVIIGIINVVQEQTKELPVIGSLANSFKI